MLTHTKIKDVWGETIKKGVIIAVLVMAMLAVAATSQEAAIGNNGVDILGSGIFETGDSAFKFPIVTDTNFDSVIVGNDNARAIGFGGYWPFWRNGPADAQNNLKIKKNQDSGPCECCQAISTSGPCGDCCTKVNIEQIKVGDRNAQAFGFASAVNNVEVITNQQ